MWTFTLPLSRKFAQVRLYCFTILHAVCKPPLCLRTRRCASPHFRSLARSLKNDKGKINGCAALAFFLVRAIRSRFTQSHPTGFASLCSARRLVWARAGLSLRRSLCSLRRSSGRYYALPSLATTYHCCSSVRAYSKEKASKRKPLEQSLQAQQTKHLFCII